MGRFLPVATTLFNRRNRLASHPSQFLNLPFKRQRFGDHRPVLQGVPIVFGSPASGPVHLADASSPTAGARHGNPLRFDFAWHLKARCISKCMGLFSTFFARSAPLGGRVDVADDRLSSVADVDVLEHRRLLVRAERAGHRIVHRGYALQIGSDRVRV
jgi:hypothetical protein